MVKGRHFTYTSSDKQTQIHAIEWVPEGEIRGILQIVHGMQEYIDRYEEFAQWMCERGYLVVGNDHLGHGRSIRSKDGYGYFAPRLPERALLTDMRELHQQMHARYPSLPYIMLGHSMGSFLAREYLCLYGQYLDGAIISGTAWHSGLEARAGMTLCKTIARFKGWRHRSSLVTAMAVGGFNKKFEPARTDHDWLTRDEAVVDAYRADERTQFTFTLNAYYGMFRMLRYLAIPSNIARMPKKLPVLFIAGEMDPVGYFGAGVKKVVVEFRSHGMKNVSCRLYPHDRHEVLNEIDRLDVYEDLLRWIRQVR